VDVWVKDLIRGLAHGEVRKITLLCGCRDPNSCHRIMLKEQIEKSPSRGMREVTKGEAS